VQLPDVNVLICAHRVESPERARGKLVADAYHAALAIEHGCEFITADADFARFPRLRQRHPLA
jgi:predicted nucleic acid-binding protein